MKKLLLFVLFALTFFACSDSSGDDNGNPSTQSSSNAYLTISNESSVALNSVVWNGISFGSIASGGSQKRAVEAGNGYIHFYVPSKALSARTNEMFVVEENSNANFYFINTTIAEEKNSNINFINTGTLISIEKAQAPKTGKVNITDISYTSVKFNSTVGNIGNPRFTDRGFCYSRELNDVDFNCHKVEGDFIMTVESLTDDTKYYVKAYISNGDDKHGKQFSEAESFTTLSEKPKTGIPSALSVGYETATIQASVVFAGIPSYANDGERGFCYGINSNPEKGGTNTICEAIAGTTSNFQLVLPSLADSTRYYARSYIDNGKHGIQYSDTVSFTTLSGMPNIAINGIVNITGNSALLRGSILNTVNSDYTEKGFCYSSTDSSPIKGTATTVCEVVSGEERHFEFELTSLQLMKIYYVRAYIENSYGIRYSNTSIFETNIFIDDRDGRTYKIKDIGSSVIWFMEDLAYGGKTQYTMDEITSACPTGWRLPGNPDWQGLKNVWEENKTDFTLTIIGRGGSEYSYWSATMTSNHYYYYWNLRQDYYGDYNRLESSSYYTSIAGIRCVKN